MLQYVYKGKRLQKRKDDATDAAMQKMRRRYGVPFMQQTFFELPEGVLLHQHYADDQFTVGYDCFDIKKPLTLSANSATETILLLYPIDNAVAIQYKHKKMSVTPPYYFVLQDILSHTFRLDLLNGIIRYFYIALPQGYIDTPHSSRPQRIHSTKKIVRIIDALLLCNLSGQQLVLFISARINDLIRYYLSTQRQQPTDTRVQRLKQVQKYIDEHLSEPLTDKVLAKLYGTGHTIFRQNFTAQLGQTPHQYILSLRMQQAKYLLQHTTSSVEEIAWEIGYNDVRPFYREFKRYFSHTPNEVRNKPL